MRKSGAVLLSDYPGELVRLACTGCERHGQYRRSTLAEQHGAGIGLPELLGGPICRPRAGRSMLTWRRRRRSKRDQKGTRPWL